MERKRFNLPDYLHFGDGKLFASVVSNSKTTFIYDADGIIVNSPKEVFSDFAKRTGISVHPAQIDRWDTLTHIAKTSGLTAEFVNSAEDGWYDSHLLGSSQRYLYIKPLIKLTVRLSGPEKNFVLTSRLPFLKDVTVAWMRNQLSDFPEKNILIRDEENDMGESAFKVASVVELAKKAQWVVLFEDSIKYVERVLNEGPENCLVVNVPLGRIRPRIEHERLFVVGRYPGDCQGMYPLFQLMRNAIK